MFVGLFVAAVWPGFSVAMSPVDSITTNRLLADRSPANELPVELVTCITNGSGVKFVVLCADESAPATSMHAAAANRKASMSLNIKTPNK